MNIDRIIRLMERDDEHKTNAMLERQLADNTENNDSEALAQVVADLQKKSLKGDANPYHEPAGSEKGGQFARKSTVSAEYIPGHEDQRAAHASLKNYLTQLDSIHRQGSLPEGMDTPEGFILKNGKEYFVNAETFAGKRDTPKMCCMNATLIATANQDRTYVEGYVTTHGIPISHAWTVDKNGQVYDSTIDPKNGKIAGYIGVPFSTKYLLKATLQNKFYGLLGYASKKTLIPLLKGEAKFQDAGNPYHEPAGSEKGGEFAQKPGSGWNTPQEANAGFYEKHSVSAYSEVEPKGAADTRRIVDQIEAADKTLTEMKSDLPSFSKYSSLRMLEVTPRKEHVLSQSGGLSGGIYNPDMGKIRLSGKLKTDAVDPEITWGKFTVGGTDTKFHPVLVHEIGHSLQSKLVAEARRRGILREQERISTLMKDVTAKDLSKYGMTNDHEFFAESFAAWRHPTYATSRKKVHPKLEAIFNILKEPA